MKTNRGGNKISPSLFPHSDQIRVNNHNLFYHLQFGFRQNYSTTHALISLTKTIRKYLDEEKFACGIFVDLQTAFDTVEHDISLTKLKH